jgi:acyl carrier protein
MIDNRGSAPIVPAAMTKQEISTFCVDQLAEILRLPKEQIDVNAKFTRLGLDSAMTVYLLMELEDRLDLELSPETFYDYPTVDALSAHLAEKIAARGQTAAAR